MNNAWHEPKTRYTPIEHFAYGLTCFGFGLAALATIVAWIEINPVAMVLSAFGWLGTGVAMCLDLPKRR